MAAGKNLRKGRYSEAGRIYLITTTTYLRQPLFRDFQLAREVVCSLRREHSRAETLCYVVMPDHLH